MITSAQVAAYRTRYGIPQLLPSPAWVDEPIAPALIGGVLSLTAAANLFIFSMLAFEMFAPVLILGLPFLFLFFYLGWASRHITATGRFDVDGGFALGAASVFWMTLGCIVLAFAGS
jgi:hypothetical protein